MSEAGWLDGKDSTPCWRRWSKRMARPSTVFVALLDEGTAAWRPVTAEPLAHGLFRLIGPVPDGESWEFQPGEVVRCVERTFSDGSCRLVAVEGRR